MKNYLGCTILSLLTSGAFAGAWTTYSLENTTAAYNTWSLGHTDSGQFVYAENGSVWQQDAFGAGAQTAFTDGLAGGANPSFIDGRYGVMGTGGWGPEPLVTFDPPNTGASFSTTPTSIQSYDGRMRDTAGAYVIGANGTFGQFSASNTLSYVTLDGSTTKTIINDISEYSCGFAMDSTGNLYVGDNDDGNVYFFAKAQLDSAISGSALEISDGTFVVDFGEGGDIGSLAVDDNGVLYGAGWNHNGIVSYDPNDDAFYTWNPGYETSHYMVDSFSFGGSNYVAFASASGSAAGSSAMYGIANMEAIPEPGTISLMMLGCGGLVWFRKRRKYLFR